MIKLYDHPLSGNCYKVRLALSHLGVEYKRIPLDMCLYINQVYSRNGHGEKNISYE